MRAPHLPQNEAERLAALHELEILDEAHNRVLDDLVSLAAQLCHVPMCAISLIDENRQYFKASVGLPVRETGREISFCGHAILQNDILVVENAKDDDRFHDNPLVDGDLHLRFYAGVPLVSPFQHALGTLCILDREPRVLSEEQRKSLEVLGQLASQELELIRSLKKEEQLLQQLEVEAFEKQALINQYQLLLENTRVGILTVDYELKIQKGYTPFACKILELPELEGITLQQALLDHLDLNAEESSRIANALRYSIGAEDMFFEANTGWLPQQLIFLRDGTSKVLHVEWSPIKDRDSDIVESVIISLHDVTRLHNLEKEAEEGRRQKRLLDELIAIGPAAFQLFQLRLKASLSAIDSLLAQGEKQKGLENAARDKIYAILHTTKGSARLMGLSEMSHQVHLSEDMLKHRPKLALRDIRAIQYGIDEIRLAMEAYNRALEPIQRLLDLIDHEPGEDKYTLRELLDEIMPLAEKLAVSKGKGGLRLQWDCEGDVQLSPELAEALSKSMIHIVRNTIDHGIEAPEKRMQKGKSHIGTFRVFRDAKGQICFQDDGAGLHIAKLRQKAEEFGHPSQSIADICELIFAKGLSTNDVVDHDSGRGVGMDAVRMFLREAGSDLEIVPLHEDGGSLFFYFALKADL